MIRKDIAAFKPLSKLKVSAIETEAHAKDAHFVETLASNAGFNLRVFTDMDEAVKWLGVSKPTISERESV